MEKVAGGNSPRSCDRAWADRGESIWRRGAPSVAALMADRDGQCRLGALDLTTSCCKAWFLNPNLLNGDPLGLPQMRGLSGWRG